MSDCYLDPSFERAVVTGLSYWQLTIHVSCKCGIGGCGEKRVNREMYGGRTLTIPLYRENPRLSPFVSMCTVEE